MNQKFYILLLVIFTIGCTDYDDDIKIDVQDYKTLTPKNINTQLKVANLILDPEEFEEMYEDYSEDIEIEGKLNLYKDGITLLENEAIEVEIKGAFSASLDLKTLGIKFEEEYNNSDRSLINNEALPFHSLDKVKAFRFRNSGNDFEYTMIKDMCYTKLAIDAGLNLDLMYAEQTVVFVNGEFLGVMNLRTESNANGMAGLYGVDKDDITLAKINEGSILIKKDGDFDRIDDFISAIEHKDYEYVRSEIDVDNFIDYMIFQSYIGNRDWPKNNVRFFAVNDGPFRFVMYDLDLVSTYDIDNSPQEFIDHTAHNPITKLFHLMRSDREFKEAYEARFKSLIKSGMLSSSTFNKIVDEYKSNIEHIMPTQIQKYHSPETFTEWYINLDHMKSIFASREKFAHN